MIQAVETFIAFFAVGALGYLLGATRKSNKREAPEDEAKPR